MPPVSAAPDDPPPVAPTLPDLDECCGSGCDPCIFDLYAEALERYQAKLKAWRERHDEETASSTPADPAPAPARRQ